MGNKRALKQAPTKYENGLMFMWNRRPRLSFINHSPAFRGTVLQFQSLKSIFVLNRHATPWGHGVFPRASSRPWRWGPRTAARMGMPTRIPFSAISKLMRPVAGHHPAGPGRSNTARPMTLSMALCLPTSSANKHRAVGTCQCNGVGRAGLLKDRLG